MAQSQRQVILSLLAMNQKQAVLEHLPDIDLDDPYPDAPNPDNDPKQWTRNRALWPDLRIQVDEKAVEAKQRRVGIIRGKIPRKRLPTE